MGQVSTSGLAILCVILIRTSEDGLACVAGGIRGRASERAAGPPSSRAKPARQFEAANEARKKRVD